MFICRVHAAPNEAQDVLFAESINAPRLMALSVSESTLSTRSLLIVQDGLCRRPAHKVPGLVASASPGETEARPSGEPQRNHCFTVCSRPLAAQVCSLQAGRSLFGFARPAL
jgi:hypothetical protein